MLVTLNDVLYKAQKEHYGVGLFNTIDTDMLEAAISAAEEMHSPIIIGTAEVLLPYGELELIAPSMIHAAEKASVPVVVHYDHGLTFDRCMEALKLGFSSIMFDGSGGDPTDNIEHTREIVKICHSMGASVEGEIGHVGDAANNDNVVSDMYTTPEEAIDFIEKTGVDALAVAIGTAHGPYKTTPRLDLGRLRLLRQNLDIPLVLHGGSGLSDDDFKNTIRDGIAKINIFTNLCQAGVKSMSEGTAGCSDGYESQNMSSYLDLRNMKVDAIREEIKKKMRLFGSVDKA